MASFSIHDAIAYGWNAFKKQPIIIVYIFIAMVGPQIVSSVFGFILRDASEGFFSTVVGLTTSILSLVLSVGMIRVLLNVYENKTLEFKNLYEDWKLVGWYLLGSVFSGLAMVLGLILLIIPGIYIALRFSFWQYFLLDGGTNAIDALGKSWSMTKGKVWNIFFFGLVQVLIVILGFLALFFGVFIAIPVVSLAHVYVYKKYIKTA